MDDIFRAFFGFPGGQRNRGPPLYDEDAEEDGHSGFPFVGIPPPHWHHSDEDSIHGDGEHFHFQSEVDDMFRHFEEMFKSMGMIEFPPVRPNLPRLEMPDEDPSASSLRDRMLKEPDSHLPSADSPSTNQQPLLIQPPSAPPGHFDNRGNFRSPLWGFRRADDKLDIDLDEEIRKNGLERVLPKNEEDTRRHETPQFRSQFRSQSVRIIRGADGKMEEHRTVTDGQGNKETTVTRRLGEQTHSVTTTEDGQGGHTKTENFNNINQSELDEFNRRWTNPS